VLHTELREDTRLNRVSNYRSEIPLSKAHVKIEMQHRFHVFSAIFCEYDGFLNDFIS